MDDLNLRSASELARRIRRGELSAEEVLERHLRQIAAHNGRLNAIVTLNDAAKRRAAEADQAIARGEVWGPLHGVPITVKDCFQTAGLRTTSGFPPLKRHVPTSDATVVARLKAAGAVLVGKTNLSMLAADWQTDNPVFGRTNNPWDARRTPGGSSGGSGAAVAAGFSPLDVGSDIGGSVRVPAHFCGVYALKPTEHRVPSTGHIPDWHIPGVTSTGNVRHMGVYGPLARSIDDLRLCFSLIAGPDGRQPEVPAIPAAGDIAPQAAQELRIAWTDQFGDAPVSSDTLATLERLAATLTRHGAQVERVEPELDFASVWQTWGEVVGVEVGSPMPFVLRNLLRLNFMRMRDRSPLRKGLLRSGRMSTRAFAAALAQRDETIRTIDALLARFDAWLCPVAPTPAFTHRKPGSRIEMDAGRSRYFDVLAYTAPFNVSGHPVVVLPVGLSSEGLPIGVQVAGHRWRDEQLLAVSAALDALIGDHRFPPGYGPVERDGEIPS